MSRLRQWRDAHNSRAYEVRCAWEATHAHAEMTARVSAHGSGSLGEADMHHLEASIVRWARACAFNEMMRHWRWWHGPTRPYSMEWAEPFIDDIDPRSY